MRKSGVLLPVTCLPSKYGIGCFSKSAYDFVDFLEKSHQSYWQILPLGHTGYGDSPYQAFSAFAGNPYMVSLEKLTDEGLLSKEECDKAYFGSDIHYIDYAAIYNARFDLLRKAYKNSSFSSDEKFREFESENNHWLEDYCLFMAIKNHFGGKNYIDWDEDIRNRQSLQRYKEFLLDDVNFYKFIQYKFYCQWQDLKAYANSKNIKIIGDIPIYVAPDSADVWSNPELFMLDRLGKPSFVAGCPPDGFSPLGQNWGNPVYNWQRNKDEGYKWWISRISHSFKLYDVLRIDHFRGFEKFYRIPYGMPDAREGSWENGPGIELFDAIEKALGKKEIIAEDLGFITDEVRKLLKDTGFMGIKVLEFAFDERDGGAFQDYLPHNYPGHCVAYTGTHDNEPISSWFRNLGANARENVRRYLWNFYTPENKMYKSLICSVMHSPASIVILPMWDILGLGEEARINTPGTFGLNWRWRMSEDMISEKAIEFLGGITRLYDRI